MKLATVSGASLSKNLHVILPIVVSRTTVGPVGSTTGGAWLTGESGSSAGGVWAGGVGGGVDCRAVAKTVEKKNKTAKQRSNFIVRSQTRLIHSQQNCSWSYFFSEGCFSVMRGRFSA